MLASPQTRRLEKGHPIKRCNRCRAACPNARGIGRDG